MTPIKAKRKVSAAEREEEDSRGRFNWATAWRTQRKTRRRNEEDEAAPSQVL